MLNSQGLYTQAKAAHEQSLRISEQLEDLRGQAISRAQLGLIAFEQREYGEAQQRYQEALVTFQMLGEPASEALAWHRLGMVAQKQQYGSEAERCYRESLALREQLGDLVGAAQTCNHLGQVAEDTDRFEEAKGWYQRALVLDRQTDATSGQYAGHLINLAAFLVREIEAGRVQDAQAQLEEAQRYAEQALIINERSKNPDLWMTFSLLTEIANRQGHIEAESNYRRREREAYAAFGSHRFQIDQSFGSLLPILAAAQNNLVARVQAEKNLPDLEAEGWHLTHPLRRLWAGERDWQQLSEGLDNEEALVILRVLEIIASL